MKVRFPRKWVVFACMGLGAPAVHAGDICTVPGDRPSIQAAVDDPSCDGIVLADQVYTESVLVHRPVSIAGPAGVADIAGLVEVRGASTSVYLTDLKIVNDCQPGVLVTSLGGQATVSSVELVTSPGGVCPIFVDGFESGNTLAWTATLN